MYQYTAKDIKRFWVKVAITADDEKCWEWQACKTSDRYGQIWMGHKIDLAHRVSWEIENGEIPNGLWVLHECDNPACVNPKHLFLGTNQDNIIDKVNKGRQSKGEQHGIKIRGEQQGSHKVTADKVKIIRQRYAEGGITQMELAKEYGLKQPQISSIIRREFWKHI